MIQKMALVNPKKVNFDEIRVIFCLNGYYINHNFIVLEIGYWSRKLCGVIPFQANINSKNLSDIEKLSFQY